MHLENCDVMIRRGCDGPGGYDWFHDRGVSGDCSCGLRCTCDVLKSGDLSVGYRIMCQDTEAMYRVNTGYLPVTRAEWFAACDKLNERAELAGQQRTYTVYERRVEVWRQAEQ